MIVILIITIIILFIIVTIDIIFSPNKQNQNNNYEENKECLNIREIDESYIKIEPFFISNSDYKNNNTKTKDDIYYDLEKYIAKQYVMTITEKNFYKELKKITDELNMTIFPQVNLERIIRVKDNNYRDRNRIKSRSIDYTIVKNSNYKIICCIELDDYTHNTEKAKKADDFKNQLFQKVGIELHRIKVSNNYDNEQIKEMLRNDLAKID